MHIDANSHDDGQSLPPEDVIASIERFGHSNEQPAATASEAVSRKAISPFASAPGTADGIATPQRPLDEHGELTDIDLGSPPEGAAAPQSGDLVPISTPLPNASAGLSNRAETPPRPRSDVAGSGPSDEPDEIDLGSGVRSITLTTYVDSGPLASDTMPADSRPGDNQVRAALHQTSCRFRLRLVCKHRCSRVLPALRAR